MSGPKKLDLRGNISKWLRQLTAYADRHFDNSMYRTVTVWYIPTIKE